MRELTLMETGYLCGVLVLSLVLPMLRSFRGPRDAAARKACMKTVWAGQGMGALAGVVILGSATLAPYALALAVVSCVGCVVVLIRQVRAVKAE